MEVQRCMQQEYRIQQEPHGKVEWKERTTKNEQLCAQFGICVCVALDSKVFVTLATGKYSTYSAHMTTCIGRVFMPAFGFQLNIIYGVHRGHS